jgi:FtsH-binding integral membrane protein
MAISPQNRFATYGRTVDQAAIDEGLRAHMLRVYNLMASGLVVSGLVAALIEYTSFGQVFFEKYTFYGRIISHLTILGWVGIFAPLAILMVASFTAQRMTVTTTQAVYWAFVATQGIGLSTLLQAYTSASVVLVFFVTAAAFAGLSIYGYTTQRSLSGFGSFLIMGMIGMLICMVVNIFVQSTAIQFMVSAVGVLIFSGLIAVDTQRIKDQYFESMGSELAAKTAIWSALSLYLDFINLLHFLLALFGDRR